jgi:hypothetical protein
MQKAFNQYAAIPGSSVQCAAAEVFNEWKLDFELDGKNVFMIEGEQKLSEGAPDGRSKLRYGEALAHKLFGDKEAVIHLYMPEFSQRHNVCRLFGTPPGFVGFDNDKSTIIDRIRQRPSGVLVLEEIEKCHPDTMADLKRAFQSEKFTDTHGYDASTHGLVVMMCTDKVSDRTRARRERERQAAIEKALRDAEFAIECAVVLQTKMQVMKPLRLKF